MTETSPETSPQDTFLIEIRLARTKWRIKRTTEQITSLFSIPEFAEKHPHVTLFGPFTLQEDVPVPRLLAAVEGAAKSFSLVPFLINGYDMNQGLNGAVLAYRIEPGEALTGLNAAISSAVGKLAGSVNVWDTDPGRKWFHVTIANRLDRVRGTDLYAQLTRNDPVQENSGSDHQPVPLPPVLDEDGIRISIIHSQEIIAEYDLIRHQWFNPGNPDAGAEWQRTLQQFRRMKGIELTRQADFKNRLQEIYVISDLHLGHTNIIRYCSRPFPHDAVDEMDTTLIRNWNLTVQPDDPVFHIGDLSYGSEKKPSGYLRRLNGRVTLIAGNHDPRQESLPEQVFLTAGGISFMLVHDPADVMPQDPSAPVPWVVHGHHHNNNLAKYPFLSFKHRQINVSCEVTGYRPVGLIELAGIIHDYESGNRQERGTETTTIPDILLRNNV